jgi:transcriptional regulator with XRE-family HTH domain
MESPSQGHWSRLRHERKIRGWTQQEVIDHLKRLAHECGYGNRFDGLDVNTLSRYERGRIGRPRDPLPDLFAALYGKPAEVLFPDPRQAREGTLAEIGNRRTGASSPEGIVEALNHIWANLEALASLGNLDFNMLRRQFLQFLCSAGGATTAAALLPAGGDDLLSPGPFQQDHRATWQALAAVDPEQVEEVVGYLRRAFTEFSTADWLLGPQLLLTTIPSHVALIERLLRLEGIPGTTKDDLLNVGSRYAEFASWLHQDSGDREKASYWADRSLGWAQEADNPLMVSYVLTRKSNQAAAQRDATSAIRLAQAAQRDRDRLTARALAVALQQEGLGHALARDEVACQRRLDDALSLAVQSQREQDGGPGRYCTPGYVEIQRATCLMTLGKPKRAIDLFERELARLPLVHRRDRGVYLARLSISYEANGDRDAARAKAQDALMIAQATGSGRIITELQPLQERLAQRQPLPDASQLLKALGIST